MECEIDGRAPRREAADVDLGDAGQRLQRLLEPRERRKIAERPGIELDRRAEDVGERGGRPRSITFGGSGLGRLPLARVTQRFARLPLPRDLGLGSGDPLGGDARLLLVVPLQAEDRLCCLDLDPACPLEARLLIGDPAFRQRDPAPGRDQLELKLREGEVQAGERHFDVRDPVAADQRAAKDVDWAGGHLGRS